MTLHQTTVCLVIASCCVDSRAEASCFACPVAGPATLAERVFVRPCEVECFVEVVNDGIPTAVVSTVSFPPLPDFVKRDCKYHYLADECDDLVSASLPSASERAGVALSSSMVCDMCMLSGDVFGPLVTYESPARR